LARIFIISNRVAVPKAGVQPGGLEVVLKSTLKKHSCVWLGWSGKINNSPRTHTIKKDKNS
jgi:trehalose 6-phosphate synthase